MSDRADHDLLARALSLPVLAGLRGELTRVGGEPVYLVGGAVRDLLCERTPADLDLVVDGPVAALARRLGAPTTHDRFETATVVTEEGLRIDVARSRREMYAAPGALPEVGPAPIEEDLRRRDFTVNALAVALNGPRAGELLSVPHALADLSARQLRVLHERSFVDDPTRLLRLARYRGRLGFSVEPRTSELVGAALAGEALATISGARVGHELRLLAREPDPVSALEALAALGVDRAIEPRFSIGRQSGDLATARRALEILPGDGRRDLLVLATAMRHVPPPDLDALLRRLAFTAGDREVVVAAATQAESLAQRLERSTLPSAIAAAVGGAAPEQVALAGALGARPQAQRWLDRLRHLALAIDGADLRAAGVPEGPALGAGLTAARMALLDGDAADRERQLELAVAAAEAHPSD